MSDNDWLKYNASEYTVNGVTYRNLEAQVLKNKEDIEAIDVSGLEDDVEQLQTDVGSLGDDIDALESGKQDKLTAGSNITITGNTISATDTTYEAGEGIEIEDGVISATGGVETPEILWCTTSTTYAEITAALAADQLPVLYAGSRIYTYLEDPSPSLYRFVCIDPSAMVIRYYDVNTSDQWTSSTASTYPQLVTQISGTLTAAGWNTTLHTQNITFNRDMTGLPFWASPDPSTEANVENWLTSKIVASAQGNLYVTFRYDGDAPTSDITVNMAYVINM